MGVVDKIVSEVATDAAYKMSGRSKERAEQKKWMGIFAVFALAGMLAFFIQRHSMDGADLLGGKKTIERFMRSNVIAMVILLLAAVGYIILLFRTWKRDRSIAQFAFTICSGVILLFCGNSIFRSIHNIQKDLDSPKTVTVESFVTCKGGSNEYYAVFDQEGTIDSILLRIPADKYELLAATPADKSTYLSRSYRLVEEAGGYVDTVLHSAKIDIVYYANSVIYEDIILSDNKQ